MIKILLFVVFSGDNRIVMTVYCVCFVRGTHAKINQKLVMFSLN